MHRSRIFYPGWWGGGGGPISCICIKQSKVKLFRFLHDEVGKCDIFAAFSDGLIFGGCNCLHVTSSTDGQIRIHNSHSQ